LHAAAPDWVGLVYCEPEHATLCPLPEVLRVVREGSAALVCVDARAALVGAPLAVDDWGIDLCLASADHALSVPVDAALVTVSPAAWRRAEAVGYRGWEALSRWRDPSSQPGHPYAPGANALYALAMSARELLGEGLDLAQARHREVAWYARDRVRRADLGPFPTDGLVAAPTITGVLVPANMPWAVLADGLVERGVALGRGSDGAGRPVALCGHMGAQADLALVKRALDALIDLVPLPAYGRD
jgi:aspartate aminotransferase-like enzyme